MHVECVTNIIPGMNDDEQELNEMANWIKRELGPETPWHITRFYPFFKLQNIPYTPLVKLERIRTIGLHAGLRYVYLGNVAGHPGENTFCYQCNALLIERRGFRISQFNIREGKCPKCNTEINGIFSPLKYPC
jgi:pyruvate formate lyase activating enzyme